jgi:hypothetical protein
LYFRNEIVLLKADWEDMTGSTPLEVNKDVVHFTTKVSALFWILVIHDQQRSFPFYMSDIFVLPLKYAIKRPPLGRLKNLNLKWIDIID